MCWGVWDVLPGKIQTDKLESRFGQYRSMAGSQYHISVRQMFGTENKLRLSKQLRLSSHHKGDISITFFDDKEVSSSEMEPIDDHFLDINVNDSDIFRVEASMPVIVHLAGYCA
nr:uncharacterized protein LOC122271190 [Parasteatoda tepidariorum]